jgi:hypothetical protein
VIACVGLLLSFLALLTVADLLPVLAVTGSVARTP